MKRLKKSVFLSFFIMFCAIQTAGAATYFYVDPTYNGMFTNGSETRPWRFLEASSWATINAALSSGNVTVYFSARQSTVDRDEEYGSELEIKRTDRTTHRLTLDGRTKYNKDDSSGAWASYSGLSRMRIRGQSYGICCFQGGGKQNYITLDGFKLSYVGTSGTRFGIYYFGGDYVQILNNEVNPGGIYFEYAHGEGGRNNGGCKDITIRGNYVTNPLGEGIYIGGGSNTGEGGHSDIRIEFNTIHDCGTLSGEGDGIDIKDENSGLVVRGNISFRNGKTSVPGFGIVSLSPGLFERNKTYENTAGGIYLDSYWPLDGSRSWLSDMIIRNNVAYANEGSGIRIQATNNRILSSAQIYNNSLYNNGPGKPTVYNVSVDGVSATIVKNNSTSSSNIGNGGECYLANIISLTENYNNFHGRISGFSRGPNDLNADPQYLSSSDLRIMPTSPCKDAGTTIAGFSDDYYGVSRPKYTTWDIGAYEYTDSGQRPAPPQNLRIVLED